MILGDLTVACYNIATVNMMMAVGGKKHSHHFDLPLFFNNNMTEQPGGLRAECVQVSCKH